MKNFLLVAAFCSLSFAAFAQATIAFDEEISITNYIPQEFVMPPSPLSTQVIFVGGYDIVQTTPTYGNPAGRAIAKEWHDFIGFTPDSTGASLGWVSVNHEMIYQDDRIGDGGGMTAFRINKDENGEIVIMDQTLEDGRSGQFFNVDFVNTVGETAMNCAGISAPNGRIWTAEEWYRTSAASIYNGASYSSSDNPDRYNPHNPAASSAGLGVRIQDDFVINTPEYPLIDGDTIERYQNFNYMVEIDPKQAKAIRKQYNWGRAGWEGGAITPDGKYVYLGIDATPAPWVRVTATTPWDFTDVTLEVYKHDNPQGQRWVAIDMNKENIFGGLSDAAFAAGATMYVRNEWVAIDPATGVVYWSETGRDSGSSGPGILFSAYTTQTNAVVAPHHDSLAVERGFADATDTGYQDYYGRVLYYDPATEEVGVAVQGGPYFANGVDEANYPDKHLSNPDGLNILTVGGKTFLMIQEDLNGTSFGRMPNGINNPMCELYLLSTDLAKDASVDDLVRVTAIPSGAEITGAIQIDDNTVLVNAQHPNSNNPFPYNHSVTMAIHGFANATVTTDLIEAPEVAKANDLVVYPNPTTREVYLSKTTDFAVYNANGQRLKVYRNANHADMANFAAGTYYIITADKESYKIIVQ